jgi:NTE family protein
MSGSDRPRVGMVLGAGGVLGGGWLVGALHAIASESGWDPGSAERSTCWSWLPVGVP